MTPQAAARIQSAAAKGGSPVAKAFADRAQSAAAHNSGGKGGGGKK